MISLAALPLLPLLAAPQQLPEPFETPWNRAIPSIVERPEGATLAVPPGFVVNVFAEDFAAPRRLALAPNGDVFVAESRSGAITLLRDADGDGVAEHRETFAEDLTRLHRTLGEITGEYTADDLLGEIFSRFCIGK